MDAEDEYTEPVSVGPANESEANKLEAAVNTDNLMTLFALSNLWMAPRSLLQRLHG